MTAKKSLTIGILTGGGDVPGLNPCIKALVYRGIEEGLNVVGIKRGWAGLFEFNPDDPESREKNFVELDRRTVRTIDRSGGTYLHTSRTNPGKVKYENVPEFLKGQAKEDELNDFTEHVLSNLEHLGIDVLIPIGGDDTLSYGERLHEEGFPAVAIPKTMDNDVHGTDYCIGFSTAVHRDILLPSRSAQCSELALVVDRMRIDLLLLCVFESVLQQSGNDKSNGFYVRGHRV